MVLELQLKNPGHEEEEPAGWQDMGFQTLPAPLLQNSSAFLSLHIESLSVSAWGFVWKVCVFCLRGKRKWQRWKITLGLASYSWDTLRQVRWVTCDTGWGPSGADWSHQLQLLSCLYLPLNIYTPYWKMASCLPFDLDQGFLFFPL